MPKKQVYHYCVCGLLVQSDTELPELAATTKGQAQIRIKLSDATVPFENDPLHTKPFSKLNKSEFYFELPNVIRFLVRNGSEVLVEYLTYDTRFANEFIYSNALPMALLQRGIITFRASGIIDANDKVWLFFAAQRAGITSTAMFLMERGYRYFGDQIVSIRQDGSNVFTYPFGPTIHIWKPVLDKQTLFKPENIRPIREGLLKYSATIPKEKYDSSERQVQGLIEVEHLTKKFSHENIKMIDAFEILRNSIYLNHLTSHMGLESRIFGVLSQLVKQTKIMRVTRPKHKGSFHEFAEYLDLNIIGGGKND